MSIFFYCFFLTGNTSIIFIFKCKSWTRPSLKAERLISLNGKQDTLSKLSKIIKNLFLFKQNIKYLEYYFLYKNKERLSII